MVVAREVCTWRTRVRFPPAPLLTHSLTVVSKYEPVGWHSLTVDVEDIAFEALTREAVQPVTRSGFALGEAKAVAIDAHDGIAAVLVIRRRRDEGWTVDVVKFVDADGAWMSLGSGGATYGSLPIDHDPDAPPSLGPTTTSWAVVDEGGLVTVGGFVIGPVGMIEVVLGDQRRSVALVPGSSAFVVATPAGEDGDIDAIDVRALDARGLVVESTAASRAARLAARPVRRDLLAIRHGDITSQRDSLGTTG